MIRVLKTILLKLIKKEIYKLLLRKYSKEVQLSNKL